MRAITFLVIGVLLSTAGAGAAAPAQKLGLTMTEFQFAPKVVSIKRGTAIELTVVNKGAIAHEFMLYPPPGSMPMHI